MLLDWQRSNTVFKTLLVFAKSPQSASMTLRLVYLSCLLEMAVL